MKTLMYINRNHNFMWFSTWGRRTFDIINGIDIMSRNVFDYEKFFGSNISIRKKSCFTESSVVGRFDVKSKREYVKDKCFSKHIDHKILKAQYISLNKLFKWV